MITDATRISLYDYLATVFASVTENLYSMTVPTENTKSDTEDGFIVTSVGNLVDESEFKGDAYGWARCQVTAFVPKRTRGRLNKTLYAAFETAINDAIDANTGLNNTGGYYIMEDSILSIEDNEDTQKGNQYHVFAKSFVVVIDQQEQELQSSNN